MNIFSNYRFIAGSAALLMCAGAFSFAEASVGIVIKNDGVRVQDSEEKQLTNTHLSLEAIELALAESKEALEEVEDNLQHTPRRIDKASLKAAKKKLIGTIRALEWQRTNLVNNQSRLFEIKADAEEKRVIVESQRRAIERQVVEEIVSKKQELEILRQQVLRELEQTREELAIEIQRLQTAINSYRSNQHAERLRALRSAELAISEMEQQHLSAIEATEAEIKKVQNELNDKLRKQSEIEDKFKLYSRGNDK